MIQKNIPNVVFKWCFFFEPGGLPLPFLGDDPEAELTTFCDGEDMGPPEASPGGEVRVNKPIDPSGPYFLGLPLFFFTASPITFIFTFCCCCGGGATVMGGATTAGSVE